MIKNNNSDLHAVTMNVTANHLIILYSAVQTYMGKENDDINLWLNSLCDL